MLQKKRFSNFANAVSTSDESIVEVENVEQQNLPDSETDEPNKNSKKNRFASAMTNDILLESSEESSIDHESC